MKCWTYFLHSCWREIIVKLLGSALNEFDIILTCLLNSAVIKRKKQSNNIFGGCSKNKIKCDIFILCGYPKKDKCQQQS